MSCYVLESASNLRLFISVGDEVMFWWYVTVQFISGVDTARNLGLLGLCPLMFMIVLYKFGYMECRTEFRHLQE